ncbi:hypothetical protein LOTGIDRAFT_228235 [Lottia gigantea]|uniref:Uncharacterized protein n=1 Tax=Lottia gigantea TaxID=225164 RepID=V4C7D4_LOTGI|nr:hypothetical protein LOTGIDRAFT_228235 [Lottia gigantea]ESO97599.1 hypothetical protein LOTGIDRAFT_228235 [Lottia gigantea]
MLPFKVFSLAVLIVVVSSQGLPGLTGAMGGAGMSGGMGGAGMSGGMGGAVMSGGMGGAGMTGGMGGAGMFNGMGGAGMFGGMGMMGSPFMNADMMDTLSDMYGSRMAMQGLGFGSGLGNFPILDHSFPWDNFFHKQELGVKVEAKVVHQLRHLLVLVLSSKLFPVLVVVRVVLQANLSLILSLAKSETTSRIFQGQRIK